MSAESNAHVVEHGFWDYTTPGAGGMEHYERDDYLRLLDDMGEAGMNSICVLPKWLTTGYRSRLPFLDQHADNPTTRSDNALLCETGRSPYLLTQEVDLNLLARECPWCTAVSYECGYDKSNHRLGMMELAVEDAKQAGLKTFYLPRGVMTWGRWPMALPLEESWRRDTDDILRFSPQGAWWFGSGCVGTGRGYHVDVERLRQSRFTDGTQARLRLLECARSISEARKTRTPLNLEQRNP